MAIGDKKPVVMESDRAVPGGVATLNKDGKLEESQRPTVDETPTESSENAVMSSGVYSALQEKSNQNILDNWYFADPVNQRGDTVYTTDTSKSYTIDRWFLRNSKNKLRVKSDCITLTSQFGASAGSELSQVLENSDQYTGKTLTHSALVRVSAEFAPKSAQVGIRVGSKYDTVTLNNSTDWQLITITTTDANFSTYGINIWTPITFVNSVSKDYDLDIKAVKLELGSVQTLAHKEGDEWVLNDPPPNKALELAKCQRYQFKLEKGTYFYSQYTSKTNLRYMVPTPVQMHKNPTIIGEENLRVFDTIAAADVDGFTFSAQLFGNFIRVSASKVGNHNITDSALIIDGTVILDANL